ncbi:MULTISPECIES: hypothetical protein [unclassified Mycolicibacterium]|uniref:hypothetical protein n=1 Tax=unclassified Mycolicibacterium TaxID=2636767 RepID=UPI001BB3A66F|nr:MULTISPECIES: hypothetical protein [unclassified Mycolicibacterium]
MDTVEHMHVNVQTLQVNLPAVSDEPSSAAALATRNAVPIADAVLLGPLATTEAQGQLDRANEVAADDPATALALYRDVQDRLIAAGFPGHAAEFDHRVAALCVATGDEGNAIRILMDALWAADRAGSTLQADRTVRMLRNLAGYSEIGPTGSVEPRTAALGAATSIAEFVSDHLHSPVPTSIELPSSAIAFADLVDRARTILFAAEHALGNDDLAWIAEHREWLESTAADIVNSHFDVAVRLRLAVADATGDWEHLIQSARSEMPRHFRALTLARHARYMLLQAAPAAADSEWREAIGDACLAERNTDAADWLYSQRFVANRYHGPVEDKWHPLAEALSALASKPKIVPRADDVRERALASLHYDKPISASIYLRRQLLDGIRAASFHDEHEARHLLGQHYLASGELHLAASHTIGAGNYAAVPKVAAAFGDNYHDVTALMASPLSWVAASALQFATQQADLVSDDDLSSIVELAIRAINDVKSGARLDSPVLSPKISLSAYGLLAALSHRLSVTQARTVLEMLAGAVVVEEHHYRYTDRAHIEIAAGIARAHDGGLRTIAIEQLIGLYARGADPFGTSAREVLVANIEQTRGRLTEMANGGHREAAALLAYSDSGGVSPQSARAAAERLRKPTTNGPSGFGVGVGAVDDSLLAATLPADDRVECIRMLMSNARSLWEPASNRDTYLIAASNMISDLDEEHRCQFLADAIEFATDPPRSEADAFNASFSSPLGAMRINDRSDCRPAATYLAAKLANSAGEKQLVRDAAVRLIGVGSDDDYRVTKTLQLVKSELGDSVAMLAQRSWTLRSLAARLWAESIDMPDALGTALSQDSDARVRRSLARAISEAKHRLGSPAYARLMNDPRWSIRSILSRAEVPTP